MRKSLQQRLCQEMEVLRSEQIRMSGKLEDLAWQMQCLRALCGGTPAENAQKAPEDRLICWQEEQGGVRCKPPRLPPLLMECQAWLPGSIHRCRRTLPCPTHPQHAQRTVDLGLTTDHTEPQDRPQTVRDAVEADGMEILPDGMVRLRERRETDPDDELRRRKATGLEAPCGDCGGSGWQGSTACERCDGTGELRRS